MASSRPHHQWARANVGQRSFTGIGGLPHTGSVYPLANTFRTNQPDDLVERVFVDVTVGVMVRPTTADAWSTNAWVAGFSVIVAASVESIGSTLVPDPIDSIAPNPKTVLTGSLTLRQYGVGSQPDFGFLTEPWAVWSGSFESQGTRLSPTPGVGPAVQVSMRAIAQFDFGAGEPLDPVSLWSTNCYVRALFASRVPY